MRGGRCIGRGHETTKSRNDLSHDDWCRLSRAFNEVANLGTGQDHRINEFLKQRIAQSH